MDAADGGRGVTEQGQPRAPLSSVDVAQQMRAAAEQMTSAWVAAAKAMATAAGDMTTVGRSASDAGALLPAGVGGDMPRLPSLPATFSAEKVQALLDDLVDRRSQVRALRDSLTAFDEQLALLEAGLRPMLEWTKGWGELEKAIGGFWRLPPRG
jgi:hypothetical protein